MNDVEQNLKSPRPAVVAGGQLEQDHVELIESDVHYSKERSQSRRALHIHERTSVNAAIITLVPAEIDARVSR